MEADESKVAVRDAGAEAMSSRLAQKEQKTVTTIAGNHQVMPRRGVAYEQGSARCTRPI